MSDEEADPEWEDCYSCGAENAVPFYDMGGDVKCTQCGAEFTWDWMSFEDGDGNWDSVYGMRLKDGY